MKHLFALLLIVLAAGCTTGVVPAGPDTYMLSGSVTAFETQGMVKARLYQRANEFCTKRGLVMVPVSSDSTPMQVGRAGNVELFFRALKPGDPEIQRVNPEKPNSIRRIELR